MLATPCFAGAGFRLVDQDAAATARGNVFTATAENPSAIYYNPAGITRLGGLQVRAGEYGVGLWSDVRTESGDFENRHEVVLAPQIFATWTPEKSRVSFGLGLYAPYGLAVKYPDDTPFRTAAKDAQIQYGTVNPVPAVKTCRSLSGRASAARATGGALQFEASPHPGRAYACPKT